MSFEVRLHPERSIVVITLKKDYDLINEIALTNQTLLDILGNAEKPINLITVFDLALSLDEVILGASSVSRGESPVWHHPKLARIIFVTEDTLIQATAQGMGTPVFGSLNISIYSNLQEALASI